MCSDDFREIRMLETVKHYYCYCHLQGLMVMFGNFHSNQEINTEYAEAILPAA